MFDFKENKKTLHNLHVWWDRRVIDSEYEEGFWHLISRVDYKRKKRLFDPRRAERLPWCGPTISNADDIAVKVWAYREKNRRLRTYLWLEDWDYTIVLEKRNFRIGDVYFLITAFYVDGQSRRNNLQKKYKKRIA
jgi:hypothetical protein